MLRFVHIPRPVRQDGCAGRRSGHSGHHGIALPASVRRLLAGLLLTTVLLIGAAPAVAQTTNPTTVDPVAEADASIARLRQEADALGGRYFDALAGLADVQRRIDEIEGRIPTLEAQTEKLRELTRLRAVTAYKRAGNDLGNLIGADGPLDAARRAQWLDRLNARDDVVADDLRATTTKLAAQRVELRTTKESAATALDEVKAQGQAIDALLTEAQERRRVATATTTTTTVAVAGAPTGPSSVVPTTAPGSTTTPTRPKPTPSPAPPTYAPTPGTHPSHNEPFLVCTRTREASGSYAAYNPAGPYMGAYQFLQSTWNSAANHAGRPNLIGVPPSVASQYDQDEVAWSLYQWRGSGPWGGLCDDV